MTDDRYRPQQATLDQLTEQHELLRVALTSNAFTETERAYLTGAMAAVAWSAFANHRSPVLNASPVVNMESMLSVSIDVHRQVVAEAERLFPE